MAGLVAEIPEFGRIDAESEAQLGDFFLRTDAYQRIEDQDHIVVTGRKGTGKTAIYKTLLSRRDTYPNVLVAGLQFRDYPWGTHSELADAAASAVERYASSWRFLILVELAKLVLSDQRHQRPGGPEAVAAEKVLTSFIEKNWGQINFEFRDIFRKREYTFRFEPKVFGSSLGTLDIETVKRDRLAGVLTEANRWLLECLRHLLVDEEWYFVLFDDLDLGYDPLDEEYKSRLIGLLLAARELFNWGHQPKQQGRNADEAFLVAPVLFLRSDIYESLTFNDKNKITQNLVETLTWTDDDVGESSLKTLISQRIRVILENGGEDPWEAVFEDQLMRGTQPKFKHMAARTYLRPRDMIQFSNLCLQRAKSANHDLISNQDIAAARPQYSEYLISELDDEIYPVFKDWRLYLDALRRIHTMRFNRRAFESVYDELRLDALEFSIDDSLELLYRFSVIGFAKIGGAGYGGSAVAFRYKDPSVSFDPAAPYFTVHPGLKEALELIEAGETVSVTD